MRLFDSDDLAALLRPRPPRLSSGEIRRQADLAALRLVAKYGHCTCADLAAFLYPGRYAVQSAQRLARRLIDQSLLAQRQNAFGGRTLVLRRKGVAFLELHGTRAHHGMDLASVTGPTFRHHAITSRFCQTQELLGVTAWPEYAVGLGQAPLSQREVHALCGKLPDAILYTPTKATDAATQRGSIEAVEVEQAKKGTTSLARCLRQAERASSGACVRGLQLSGVIFVFDSNQAHASRIARVAHSIWSPAERVRLSKYVRLAQVDLRPPLVFGGWTIRPFEI